MTKIFCNECLHEISYHDELKYHGLCLDCYVKLFVGIEPKTEDDDEDFVLKSDIAEIGEVKNQDLVTTYNNFIKLASPKPYNLDFDKITSIEDMRVIAKTLFGQVIIYDNLNGFENIKQFLKEK